MQEKIQRNYIETCFGFPILIEEVSFFEYNGEWIANIDYQKLKNITLRYLAFCNFCLSGKHLNFIRFCSGYELDAFCKKFKLSVKSVIDWRKFQYTEPLSWEIEKEIRLYVLQELLKDSKSHTENLKQLDGVSRSSQNHYPIMVAL